MSSASIPTTKGTARVQDSHAWKRVRRAVRSPKGTLLLLFVPMILLALPRAGASEVLPGLFAAVAVAVVIDMATAKLVHNRWIFPDGAILSALIVASSRKVHKSQNAVATNSIQTCTRPSAAWPLNWPQVAPSSPFKNRMLCSMLKRSS